MKISLGAAMLQDLFFVIILSWLHQKGNEHTHHSSCLLEPRGNERFRVKLQKEKLFKASEGFFFFFLILPYAPGWTSARESGPIAPQRLMLVRQCSGADGRSP